MRQKQNPTARWAAALSLPLLVVASALSVAASSGRAAAQDVESAGPLKIAVAPELIDSGLIAWLTPRFRFKTRITLEATPTSTPSAAAAAGADLVIVETTLGAAAALGPAPVPVVARGDVEFAAATLDAARFPDADVARAKQLVRWLISEAGARAIGKFAPSDGAPFGPPGWSAPQETTAPTPATAIGEKLALQHCGRCHVVNEKNKYGGIGSTPSFAALRTIPNDDDRFAAFWVFNPHPSFTQVEGVTAPFPADRPPHIAPIELTLAEAEAIAAYAATIPPKDLGAAVQAQ